MSVKGKFATLKILYYIKNLFNNLFVKSRLLKMNLTIIDGWANVSPKSRVDQWILSQNIKTTHEVCQNGTKPQLHINIALQPI